jgi:hypothetical protein
MKKKIRELRTDAASGPDGLGPKVLQELQDELSPVPEFIDPVLGFKTLIFMKTSTKCSFSFQSMLRDAGIG